jgi:hypothetical protein
MATVTASPTNEASRQSGTTIMGEIGMIEERLAAQAKVQQRLLEFAQELKASIDLAHERISGVAEGLVRVGEVIGDPPSSKPRGTPETDTSPHPDE